MADKVLQAPHSKQSTAKTEKAAGSARELPAVTPDAAMSALRDAAPDHRTLRPAEVLALQRVAGNRAVNRLLGSAGASHPAPLSTIQRDPEQDQAPADKDSLAPTKQDQIRAENDDLALADPSTFVETKAGGTWTGVKSIYNGGKGLTFVEGLGPAENGTFDLIAARVKHAGMNAILAFRLAMTLLKAKDASNMPARWGVKKSIMQQVQDDNAEELGKVGWNYGAGSATPTSDIDSNMFGDGTELAVGKYNEAFRTLWHKESGIVFDVNVYAKDYIPGGLAQANKAYKESQAAKVAQEPLQVGASPQGDIQFETVFTTDTNYRQAMRNEEIYSLVKTRMDMTEDDWHRYTSAQLAGAGSRQAAMRGRFEEVERIYKQRQREIEGVIASEHLTGSAEEQRMGAENRLYAAKLKRVSQLRAALAAARGKASLAEKERLYLALMEALHQASLFANEAYVTGAAVQHVVGNTQMGGNRVKSATAMLEGAHNKPKGVKILLTVDQYMHSFNEQMGFIFKELEVYKKAGFDVALSKAGKYIYRMGNAASHIADLKGDRECIPGLDDFRNFGRYLFAAKLVTQEEEKKAGYEKHEILEMAEAYYHRWSDQPYGFQGLKNSLIRLAGVVGRVYDDMTVTRE